jgi:glutathione S-transferase
MTNQDGFSRMTLKLVIGNKNYSSWSMRPWLALRANDIAFDEVFIPLYTGDADKKRILGFTRSGKVPALVDGDVTIWDSLAIIEYLAERFPEKRLWPEDRAQRAHARSISAEMHSGFAALRNECGMNLHRPVGAIELSAHPDHFCLAPLAAPTRCSRRWCIGFAPMRSRLSRSLGSIWRR